MANRVRPGNSGRGGVRRDKVTAEAREMEKGKQERRMCTAGCCDGQLNPSYLQPS
jgi:hypothetical protein